jgi:hypothetical protein
MLPKYLLNEAGTVDPGRTLSPETVGGADELRGRLANSIDLAVGSGRTSFGYFGEQSCLSFRGLAGGGCRFRGKSRVMGPGQTGKERLESPDSGGGAASPAPDRESELCIISIRSSSAAACSPFI